ncbi:MAG: hypothetical protein M1828_005299 [Chrysothrix sp. TS-e1954]|nr:MAG: hypothetical protein M1828_005299 [Chrysothrix sp. TS-e1954]
MHSPTLHLTLLTLTLTTITTHAAKLYDDYSFSALTHLSDASPYFIPNIPPKDPDPPPGCKVTRAAYLVRNGAIFTDSALESSLIAPFVHKLQTKGNATHWCNVNGTELAFLHDWARKPAFNASDGDVLARAGKLEANTLGVQMSWRYPGLAVPRRVWSASSQRAFRTAENLVRGLELPDGQIQVVAVPESDAVPQPDTASARGSLTPHQVCGAYDAEMGSEKVAQYVRKYTGPILARFETLIPDFPWESNDVLAMQELCGYETATKASSSFCSSSLFSSDEWLAFEYARDLDWFFRTGYGNVEMAGTLGMGWVDAMMKILTATASKGGSPKIEDVVLDAGGQLSGRRKAKRADETPNEAASPAGQEQDLYLSVSHAELLASVLTTLGLFNDSAYSMSGNTSYTMPLDRINHARSWSTSNMLPFLGNIAIEKMNCSSAYGLDEVIDANDGDFYRVLVNEAPQVWPGCADGPAESCSRAGLQGMWEGWTARFGNWAGLCGTDGGAGSMGGKMDFFWEPGNGTAVG